MVLPRCCASRGRRGGSPLGDVAAGSKAARFLNGFVDAHTEQGHAGRFYEPPVLAGFLADAGGRDVRSEEVRGLRGGSRTAAPRSRFCCELFGLRAGTRTRGPRGGARRARACRVRGRLRSAVDHGVRFGCRAMRSIVHALAPRLPALSTRAREQRVRALTGMSLERWRQLASLYPGLPEDPGWPAAPSTPGPRAARLPRPGERPLEPATGGSRAGPRARVYVTAHIGSLQVLRYALRARGIPAATVLGPHNLERAAAARAGPHVRPPASRCLSRTPVRPREVHRLRTALKRGSLIVAADLPERGGVAFRRFSADRVRAGSAAVPPGARGRSPVPGGLPTLPAGRWTLTIGPELGADDPAACAGVRAGLRGCGDGRRPPTSTASSTATSTCRRNDPLRAHPRGRATATGVPGAFGGRARDHLRGIFGGRRSPRRRARRSQRIRAARGRRPDRLHGGVLRRASLRPRRGRPSDRSARGAARAARSAPGRACGRPSTRRSSTRRAASGPAPRRAADRRRTWPRRRSRSSPGAKSRASDRVAVGLSPSQILGFVRGALNALAIGAEAVFYSARRDPLAEAAGLGATMVLLPSALVPLAGRRGAPAALARAPVRRRRAGLRRRRPRRARIAACLVRAGYGLTESAGLGARQPVARPRRAGIRAASRRRDCRSTIVGEGGRPCAAGEPGEIRISGAAVFPGYLFDDDPSPFDAAGRFCTGDVGSFDASGELCVRGRLAFALTAGRSGRLRRGGGGGDRRASGRGRSRRGAAGPAFGILVVSRDASASTLDELRQHARRQLPAFARPRRIVAVAEIPRTRLGQDRPARRFTMAAKRARDRLIRAALRAARDHATPFYLFDRQGAPREHPALAGSCAATLRRSSIRTSAIAIRRFWISRSAEASEPRSTVAPDVDEARSRLSGERIVFQGPAKDPRSVLRVLASGGWVVADSPEDAAAILSAARELPVAPKYLLRLRPKSAEPEQGRFGMEERELARAHAAHFAAGPAAPGRARLSSGDGPGGARGAHRGDPGGRRRVARARGFRGRAGGPRRGRRFSRGGRGPARSAGPRPGSARRRPRRFCVRSRARPRAPCRERACSSSPAGRSRRTPSTS